jgi:hypothetical protein
MTSSRELRMDARQPSPGTSLDRGSAQTRGANQRLLACLSVERGGAREELLCLWGNGAAATVHGVLSGLAGQWRRG